MNDDELFIDPFFSKARSLEELAQYLDWNLRLNQTHREVSEILIESDDGVR